MRRFLVVLSLTLAFWPTLARAIPANFSADRHSVLFDTQFYDKHDVDFFKNCLSGAAGSGPLLGPHFPKISDTGKLVDRIRAYIEDTVPSSPLKDIASDFVSLGQQYDVNPAMAVAFAQKETSLGTNGAYAGPPHNNIFSIRNGAAGSFGDYASPTSALKGYYELISSELYLGPPSNFTTVDEILYRYAPPSDNNDTPSYIAFVKSVMEKILGGLDTTDTASPSPNPSGAPPSAPSPSPTPSVGLCSSTPGALGWDLEGAHSLINYDQIDPRWASHPYGAGKSSIGESGCGPTSLAIVSATLTNDPTITPITMADRYGSQYHVDAGTSWSLFPVMAADYKLNYQDLGTDLQAASEIIRKGGLVVMSVEKGYFTAGDGHIMVIRAVSPDGSGFYLADPNGQGLHGDSETRAFTTDFLAGQGGLKHLWGYTNEKQ